LSKISEQLSSFEFTTWTLIVLILCFTCGIWLANSDGFSAAFAQMNNTLVREWFMAPDNGFGLVRIWFVCLCTAMVFLGINLIFCSWNRILKIIRTKFNAPKFVMLVVHIIFGLVALCHLGGLMLGYEYGSVRLEEGESFCFEDAYQAMVTRVNFVDDPAILKKSRRELTRNDLYYHSDYVEVTLSHVGREIQRGRLYLLRPMRHKNIHLTLKQFVPPRPHGSAERGDGKPGVVISISENPVLGIFLVLYPLMIAGTGLYLGMTWHPRSGKRVSMKSFGKNREERGILS
jgi:hypothetical protein